MPHAYFFGYGSLVNRATHNFTGARGATLKGWRRVWRHTALRRIAYLTVVPDPTSEIEGLIAEVPGQDWAALDERERAYDRINATHQVQHALPHAPEIAVYSIPEGKHGRPTGDFPVLLSYLDVVIQGYHREFGASGVARFFDSTDGWDIPVINDRDAPVYPRHQPLSGEEISFIDTELSRRGINLMDHNRDQNLWPDP